jgi:hypothetical protein
MATVKIKTTSKNKLILIQYKLTRKFSTWQVMLQSRKSRELTVNFSSCGLYDLI